MIISNMYFILDGHDFAGRHGQFLVPRVGDEVMFHPKDGPVQYRVERVVWGVSATDFNSVNIHLTERD